MSLCSELEARAAARESIEVQIESIIKDNLNGAIRVRPLVAEDEFESQEAAVAFLKRSLHDLPEKYLGTLIDDSTMLSDAKHIERLWRACRDSKDSSKPAFPSTEWMRKVFIAAELARIAEWLGRVEAKSNKTPPTLTHDQRMLLVTGCAEMREQEFPEQVLSGLGREQLARLFVWASVQIADLQKRIEELMIELKSSEGSTAES